MEAPGQLPSLPSPKSGTGGKEGRRMGTRVKPGNQLVYHICIRLLNPHWPMPRQAVISTQQHKLSH